MSTKTVVITFFILVSYSFSISKNRVEPTRDGKTNRKDTASAVVGYGQGYLFESAQELSATEFDKLLDSILQDEFSSKQLIHEINFYKSLKDKSHAAIYTMIDSLLLLDSIPYNLINP